MSNPNPPTRPSRGARWFSWGSCLALAAFGVWLAAHATVVAGGDDSSGYFNGARLLASGGEGDDERAGFPARDLVPANALVAASSPSGALFYYTELAVLGWDLLPPEEFKRLAALASRAQRPIYALLFGEFEARARRDHLPGAWKRIDGVKNLSPWQYLGPALSAPSA